MKNLAASHLPQPLYQASFPTKALTTASMTTFWIHFSALEA